MKWLLAGLSGLLFCLAIEPRGLFVLGWIAFLPLLWAQKDQSSKQSFLLGWLAGTVSNIGNFYWNYELMVTHSALPSVVAILFTFLFCAQQGLREAIWLGLSSRIQDKNWPLILVLPTIYVASEFLYPNIFPIHLSDTQANCLLTSQWVDIAGPAGLSWLMVTFQTGLFLVFHQREKKAQIFFALCFLPLNLIYGQVRVSQIDALIESAPKLKVGMVENNFGLGRVSLNQASQQIEMARELAKSENPDLIVFPETAIKTPPPRHLITGQSQWQHASTIFYPLNMERSAQDEQFSVQSGYRVPVIFGCTAIDPDRAGPVPGRPALFNACFALDENGKVLGTGLKNKLLMFGEYVPGAQYFPWIYSKILTKASALYAGTEPETVEIDGHRIGLSICYEDILPEFSYELLQKRPELLVNVTNDGWFGKTAEPYVHLTLARARAVESRLFMVRSTCTGVSAFIDPLGRVLAQTDIHNAETLTAEIAWMPGGGLFRYVGTYFAWLCVLVTLVLLVIHHRGARLAGPEK